MVFYLIVDSLDMIFQVHKLCEATFAYLTYVILNLVVHTLLMTSNTISARSCEIAKATFIVFDLVMNSFDVAFDLRVGRCRVVATLAGKILDFVVHGLNVPL